LREGQVVGATRAIPLVIKKQIVERRSRQFMAGSCHRGAADASTEGSHRHYRQ
jgi:hypothetical protein